MENQYYLSFWLHIKSVEHELNRFPGHALIWFHVVKLFAILNSLDDKWQEMFEWFLFYLYYYCPFVLRFTKPFAFVKLTASVSKSDVQRYIVVIFGPVVVCFIVTVGMLHVSGFIRPQVWKLFVKPYLIISVNCKIFSKFGLTDWFISLIFVGNHTFYIFNI